LIDFVRPERFQLWWEEVPNSDVFYYSMIFVVFFYFVAFVELCSYYTVGYDNAGKFLIMKTLKKKFWQSLFNFLLLVLVWIYFIGITFFISWSILGAIINPSKYLPYASASATLILFIKSKYQSIKDFQNLIFKKLDEVI
jgi:hypothetical protein